MSRPPPYIIAALQTEFGQMFDVCPFNPMFNPHKDRDGLKTPWSKINWCNPPYSNVAPWLKKAHDERIRVNTTVLLLKTDVIATHYFQLYCNMAELRFFAHKIRFKGYPREARFTSVLVILRPEHKQNTFSIIDYRHA